jgi:tetratricopeptide (TPR) repeat protein
MLIELTRFCSLAVATVLLLQMATLAGPANAQGDEGQYRSKIRIEPEGISGTETGLSIAELEQQIASISDSYARSSAGRHLARHYVEEGDYAKAIEYYKTALAADGLADVANREMLRELAQVYLLSKDYAAAASTLERALRIKLVPQPGDYLLLGQAYYHLGNLSRVVAALDPIREQGLALTDAQKRQALALYYQAGAYAQCEELLQQLLKSEPNNAANWHQLASVYLQQGKNRKALDQLTLAWEKAVPFREQDTILLADLHAVNGDPYGAAEILQQALQNGTVEPNGLYYRKLFQFWLTARENERATAALVQAARMTGDIELYLYLAQLQMEQQAWSEMQQTMLAACKNQLQDKYVSRANLLLGISQLKLGDPESARRAFINATLIGGASKQAGDWLEFMGAEPATAREARRIAGVCYGSRDKQVSASSMASAASTEAAGQEAAPDSSAVLTRTVPKQQLFYLEYKKPLAELASEARSLASRMVVALIKSGGTMDGSLQIISVGEPGANPVQLAIPTRGSPRPNRQYKVRQAPEFKCAYQVHKGEPKPLPELWAAFIQELEASGLELTGETRTVLHAAGGDSDVPSIELQAGIQ